MANNNLAIVISTYRRDDNKTPDYLYRALSSIKNQTYQNYKVFLIGDKYENPNEIYDLLSKLNDNKISFDNLKIAKEREKYTGRELWSYGGVNAINYGINKALSEGYEYICHLDHDDWWEHNHLELIKTCIDETKSDWICTKSTYISNNRFIPNIVTENKYIEFKPMAANLAHSSVCMNFKKIPLLYRDIIEETGKIGLPADADLWERTRHFLIKNNLKSMLINILTCHHDEEGYERHNKTTLTPTIESINKVNYVIENMDGKTFHNHYHILYDICSTIKKGQINYLEIGAYCGGSASLVSTHGKVANVFSIDLGDPINKEIPIKNVNKFKTNNCNYTYIKGDSKSADIINFVKNNLPEIDILFIDGDHTYNGVINDFNNYKDIVSKNGFIVFDDYMDFKHSPDVHKAVNDIVKTLDGRYFDVIGSIKYDLLAKTNYPNLFSSNEFIIRKK